MERPEGHAEERRFERTTVGAVVPRQAHVVPPRRGASSRRARGSLRATRGNELPRRVVLLGIVEGRVGGAVVLLDPPAPASLSLAASSPS